jgi:two-component system, NtrC family, response regulator HydG
MPELVFLRRGEELLRIALDRSRVVLGRAETSDIVIPDAEVSGHQAAVLLDGGVAVVEDLSGKGTMVSGENTTRAPLADGADINLGQWRAIFRAESSARPPTAALLGVADPQRWSTRGPFLGTVRVFDTEAWMQSSLGTGGAAAPDPGSAGRKQPPAPAIIGADPGIRQLADFIERVAPSADVVAIFGESGTGRERVARAIHARSGRVERPLVRVQCRVIRQEQLETELFGAEKSGRRGAFEEAAGGTLFLDEVGELSLELQGTLLRALESREFRRVGGSIPLPLDVRLVVATSKDLLSAVHAGKFRSDLYDRLCMAPLILPPLRRRRGDVPTLAEHLLREYSPRGQPVGITAEALGRLAQHSWPGNLRELRNVLHRALLLRTGHTIDVGELRLDPHPGVEQRLPVGEFIPGMTLEQMLRQREREIVEGALRHFDNNRERVARELGVARSTLFKRLKDWGLTKHEDPEPTSRD